MKISQRNRAIYQRTYANCVKYLLEKIEEGERRILNNLDNHDFKKPNAFDFADFAKEAFLHNLKAFYDDSYASESAIQCTKDIIRDPESLDDDLELA